MILNDVLRNYETDYFEIVYDTFGGEKCCVPCTNVHLCEWLEKLNHCEVAEVVCEYAGNSSCVMIYLVGWNSGGALNEIQKQG